MCEKQTEVIVLKKTDTLIVKFCDDSLEQEDLDRLKDGLCSGGGLSRDQVVVVNGDFDFIHIKQE